MTEAEWQINFRKMHDLARHIVQDCEAYNYTNDKEYLRNIERDASTVVSIAGLLLDEVAE